MKIKYLGWSLSYHLGWWEARKDGAILTAVSRYAIERKIELF